MRVYNHVHTFRQWECLCVAKVNEKYLCVCVHACVCVCVCVCDREGERELQHF